MDDKQEFLEERQHLLADMLRSSAWTEVARPALVKRCREIQKRLAENTRLELTDIRELQGQHAVLKQMVDEKTVVKFLLGD